MFCPSFPEAPTMQTLIVCVPERPGHSVSSDSPLDAAIDEGLRGLGAGSDSMRTTPRSGTFREHTGPADVPLAQPGQLFDPGITRAQFRLVPMPESASRLPGPPARAGAPRFPA